MKIHLKAMGEALHGALKSALSNGATAAMRSGGRDDIEWQLSEVPRGFVASDWVCQQASPTVLVIDADDAALLRTLQASQGALHHLVTNSRYPAVVRCPVILFLARSVRCHNGRTCLIFLQTGCWRPAWKKNGVQEF
jgi:hypothetical protein